MGPCHRWIVRSLSVVALSVMALPASAQLGGVGLPSMPGVGGGLPGGVGGGSPMGGLPDLPRTPMAPRAPSVPALPSTVRGLVGQTEVLAGEALTALRGQQVQALIRDHADLIDVDDQGQAVVRGEVLILSPSPQSLAIASKAGFHVGSETRLEGLDLSTVTLGLPTGVSVREGVRRLKALDPEGQYDFNHIYLGAGAAPAVARGPAARGGG
ncbi:MAG: hypothetical protein Q7T23_07795, partial [Phenylobacterium sp.]|nr:hypothetical protein [Phenylobacterium sp.]